MLFKNRKKGHRKKGHGLSIKVCAAIIGFIIGMSLFEFVDANSEGETAVSNRSWEYVESIISTKVGEGYNEVGQCTGYLYWCLKNAYGVDWGTNSVVAGLENKLINAGITKVAEGTTGEISSNMKPGDIVIFINGTTRSHCAILGEGGRLYHAISRGVNKSMTLSQWMSLPDANKNCDRYVIYRGLQSSGNLTLNKSTDNALITDRNSCYSLQGAVYGLYSNGEQVGSLTTNGDGKAVLRDIPFGTYTLKEIRPSAGFALDKKTYNITINQQNVIMNVKEVPQVSRIEDVIYKIDNEIHEEWSEDNRGQAGASLENAKYKVSFYGGYYNESTDFSNLTPERSWILKTDESGRASLNENYIVEGDELYKDSSGQIFIPLGTVTIEEIEAPEGYLVNKSKRIVQVCGEGMEEIIEAYEVPIHEEQIIRGDLELIKVEDGTMKRLSDIPFRITGKSSGESHVFMTDINGYASTASEWNLHSFKSNEGNSDSGVWFGNIDKLNDELGALPYDTYILDELPCDNNTSLNLICGVEIKIYKDKYKVRMGTVTDDLTEPQLVIVSEEHPEPINFNENKIPVDKKEIVKGETKDNRAPETGDSRGVVLYAIFLILLISAVLSIAILCRFNKDLT